MNTNLAIAKLVTRLLSLYLVLSLNRSENKAPGYLITKNLDSPLVHALTSLCSSNIPLVIKRYGHVIVSSNRKKGLTPSASILSTG